MVDEHRTQDRDTRLRQATERLQQRQAQQAAVATLGNAALAADGLQELFEEAVELTAQVLDVDFCKVLELWPEDRELLLRAGVGWDEGLVGEATVGAGLDSQAGYTLRSHAPVIVEDLATEERFAGPPLLLEHGVVSGVSVVIGTVDQPWGVLGVHARERREFTLDDVNFVQSVAHVLWGAIGPREVSEALAYSMSRLEMALEAGRMGIFDWDLRRDRLVWSKEHYALLGYDDTVEATYEAWRSRVHADDLPAVEEGIRRARETGTDFVAEYRVVHPDGTVRWLEGRARYQYGADGGPRHMTGVMIDIDARKRAQLDLERTEERLRRAQRELEHADRQKDEFLALLGHELRNPLAAVTTALDLLRDPPAPDAFKASVAMIERQSRQLQRLVDDLLHVSRITRGDIEIRPRAVPLEQALDEVTASLSDRLRERRLTIELPDEAVWLKVDPARLDQILGNLLVNATKYSDRGSEVKLTVERDARTVTIHVADEGIGMDAETLEQVFRPFVRAIGPRGEAESGLGVGLTLVKKLAELHGGTVTASSPGPGQGSTFTVTLPAASRREIAAAEEPVERRPPTGTRTPLKVLIVDDNVDLAEGLEQLLERAGHQVRVAHGGLEGIRMGQEWGPEAVLLDIGLPDIAGTEVAARLRELVESVWIAALSGFRPDDNGGPRVFDRYLIKPVQIEDVIQALNEAVAGPAPEP